MSTATYDERLQERRTAEGAVQQATAALQAVQLNLDFTQVRAPLSGRVSDRRVDIGNLVTGDPSATLLTTIVALDPIYFAFDMSESDFLAYQRAVNRGALPSTRDNETIVQAQLPDEKDWPHSGTMNFVDNRIEPGSGTIRARALLPNPGPVHHARPVRPAAHPGLERVRGRPHPRQRHRHRPVEPRRHDGDGGRHGRAEGDPARAIPARRACGSCARA